MVSQKSQGTTKNLSQMSKSLLGYSEEEIKYHECKLYCRSNPYCVRHCCSFPNWIATSSQMVSYLFVGTSLFIIGAVLCYVEYTSGKPKNLRLDTDSEG